MISEEKIAEVKATCHKIGYEYIGGYSGSNGSVIVECPKCHRQMKRNWRAVRKIACGYQKIFECSFCRETEKADHRRRIKAKAEAKASERKKQKKIEKEKEFWSQNFSQKKITFCKNCGAILWNGKSTCSISCCVAYNNKQKKDRRLRKIRGVKVSYIDIKRLFARDRGVCWICGKRCDFKDYKTTDKGVFIAGNSYPSIDHVVPLSKGGVHSWDNVRLACRGCNSRRGNREQTAPPRKMLDKDE